MEAKHKNVVETLLYKAADATDAAQALNFSQAATNSANALRVLTELIERGKQPRDGA